MDGSSSPYLGAPKRNVPQYAQDRKKLLGVRSFAVPEQYLKQKKFNFITLPIPDVAADPVMRQSRGTASPVVSNNSEDRNQQDQEEVDKQQREREKEREMEREKKRRAMFSGVGAGLEVEIPFRAGEDRNRGNETKHSAGR